MTNPPTPVEYAMGLSDEDKSRVFCALLTELIARNGGGHGPIPITAPDGEDLGYHVAPPAAQAYFDAYGPKLSEEEYAEYDRRLADEESFVSKEEFLAGIKEMLEGRFGSRTPEPSASSGRTAMSVAG